MLDFITVTRRISCRHFDVFYKRLLFFVEKYFYIIERLFVEKCMYLKEYTFVEKSIYVCRMILKVLKVPLLIWAINVLNIVYTE